MDERRKVLKGLEFAVPAKRDLLALSAEIRQAIGYQLHLVQMGLMPEDFVPMNNVGSGVYEIRVEDENDKNTGRCFYVSKFKDTVYVLHCFKKLSRKTAQKDIDTGKRRYKAMLTTLKDKEKSR